VNPIRQLDPVVIDQIAAGEVVERPASVVKELVENALDSGARRIEVLLEEGGIRRIEVRDDGCGIPPEELPLALSSHATSKLRRSEDLEAVGTLGFRGEALASIAAVSRLELLSRPAGADHAYAVRVRYGRREDARQAAGAAGTRVIVEDLFLELPARRKFLKRPSTELAHCSAWVERLALAHEGVGFRLEHGGRKLLEIAPEDDLAARCGAVLGPGLARQMVEIEQSGEGIRLEVRVGPPESARRDASRIHLFLNGRWVRDPRLLRAVREGVREFVPVGHSPALVLMLALPPDRVDVNVHPQKTEVRFRDERLVMGTIIRSLRRGLAASPWATRSLGGIGGGAGAAEAEAGTGGTSGELPPFRPATDGWQRPAGYGAAPASTVAEDVRGAPDPAPAGELPLEADPAAAGGNFLSVARTFLIREVPGGLEILDQHALHERVNLEELRAEVRDGQVVSQPLLVPALVDVDRAELDLLLGKAELFRGLGVEVEGFGETTVALRSVPARLSRLQPEALVRDLLDIAREHRRASPEQLQEEALHRMSCRGAVMAGDYVDEQALQDLLRRGAALPQDRTCAHGRPVRVFVSIEDLERAFYRR